MSETSNETLLALHGPLVLRVVNRMMQFRYTADLDRYAEAKALIAIVRAHEGLSGVDAHGDAGEGERLYGLVAGHVLTEQDVKDIECLVADHNDAIGHEADKWGEARKATLREIGGNALVAAVEARDEQMISVAVEKAMARVREITKSSEAANSE